MKRILIGLTLSAVVLLAVSSVTIHSAFAQVPPGVVVDSIAPATEWLIQYPYRAHHMIADPKSGRMAFVSGTGQFGASPVWYFSSDAGSTWSGLTGFLTGNAGRVAIAADARFAAHITYRASLPSGVIGIFYNKDPNADGTGLGTPVMVNDTNLIRTPNYPDIVVSPDGKQIIISSYRFNQIDSMWVFVSHDSGATWKSVPVISVFDPAIAPVNSTPGLDFFAPALAMGSNGYAILMTPANYDSNGQGGQWELYTETKDWGDTWTKPAWVTPPAASDYPADEVYFEQGGIVAIDSIPHFADALVKPGGTWEDPGPREMVEFHKQNGTWVYHAISHLDEVTGSFNLANNGSLGVDSLGRLYCFYSDRNKSALPSFFSQQFSNQLFVAGSSDGGNTWTSPVRLTGTERIAAGSEGDVKATSMTSFASSVASNAVGIFLNGVFPDLYNGGPVISGWGQARFPLSVVWTGPYDKDTRAPKSGGYQITAKGASPFIWYEISSTGTKVTGWRNGPATPENSRDDGYAGPFPVGFNFSYYGQSFSSFHVGANALVGLSDSVLNTAAAGPNPSDSLGFFSSGYNFPGLGNPFKSVIAAYYNDLDLIPHTVDGTGNGDVYYWTNAANDTLVVEWARVGDFIDPGDTTITFEVILAKADSSVGIMFKDLGTKGTAQTAKVGIQAADSIGVAYWLGGFPAGNTPAPNTGVIFKPGGLTAVTGGSQMPITFSLRQNYPNPFNPATKITYTLPRQVKATLKVFNILGQEVATLVDDIQAPGEHSVTFDGGRLASGVYLYRLQAGEFTSSYKMILMK